MALTYGFFNSVNHDRIYDARQMSKIFNGIINDGVFQNIGDLFAVTPHEGMDIFVGTGRAWFNGTWTNNDTNYSLTVTQSNPLYPRIDAVVLEVNESTESRQNSLKMVDGTAASEPEKPTLVNTEFIHQYPLAYITVPANASGIAAVDIENVVGLSEEGCPFVTGILQVNSVDSLYSQWDAAFQTWFDHMKDQLDSDAAGHLQNEIDEITGALCIFMVATLEAGETELSFTNSNLTENSIVELFVKDRDDIHENSKSFDSETNTITYIFEAQEEDIVFKLRIINLEEDE